MEKELIISTSGKDLQIALLEDKKLVELHHEKARTNLAVGDIFFRKSYQTKPWA